MWTIDPFSRSATVKIRSRLSRFTSKSCWLSEPIRSWTTHHHSVALPVKGLVWNSGGGSGFPTIPEDQTSNPGRLGSREEVFFLFCCEREGRPSAEVPALTCELWRQRVRGRSLITLTSPQTNPSHTSGGQTAAPGPVWEGFWSGPEAHTWKNNINSHSVIKQMDFPHVSCVFTAVSIKS